jgi:hypothetical protein
VFGDRQHDVVFDAYAAYIRRGSRNPGTPEP